MLTNGLHDVPPGKLATVVTHLEMTERPDLRPVPAPADLTLARSHAPDTGWYRDLFRRVGGLDWLWFSRLVLDDAALAAILIDPDVEVYALSRDEQAQGLLELDFRTPGECELAFFGVSPDLIGSGAGRFMMNEAIMRVWSRPIRRFHVHTCTLDSPAALPFYRRSGFVPIRQQVEIADDPRLCGQLPGHAAPQVPIIP